MIQADPPVTPGITALSPEQAVLSYAFCGLGAAFVVLPAVFGPQDQGLVRRLLRLRPLVALGVVSYGFYLWHLPVWIQAEDWGVAALPMLVQALIVFVIAVGLATASWFVVERPIIRWSTRRRTVAPAPHGGASVAARPSNGTATMAAATPSGTGAAAGSARTPVVAVVIVVLALGGLFVQSRDLDATNVLGAKDVFTFAGNAGRVHDDFQRVDPTGLGTASTGQRWDELSGTWSVANGEATVGAEGGIAVIRTRARHARAVGGGLAFRCADVSNCWLVEPVPHYRTWNLEKIVKGKRSYVFNLGAVHATPTSEVAVHLDGERIEIALDGVVRATLDDSALQGADGMGLVRTPGRATTPWTSFDASR